VNLADLRLLAFRCNSDAAMDWSRSQKERCHLALLGSHLENLIDGRQRLQEWMLAKSAEYRHHAESSAVTEHMRKELLERAAKHQTEVTRMAAMTEEETAAEIWAMTDCYAIIQQEWMGRKGIVAAWRAISVCLADKAVIVEGTSTSITLKRNV
jgi:FlaA1/EpsC-like NDP-sugar epimerase